MPWLAVTMALPNLLDDIFDRSSGASFASGGFDYPAERHVLLSASLVQCLKCATDVAESKGSANDVDVSHRGG